MPEIVRTSLRMDCSGIDLVHPLDRMPPGAFAYLFNVRVITEGRIEGRPGYTQSIVLADIPNSIRRLNDPSKTYAPSGYTYIGGGGTKLYAGIESAYSIIDTGYSGQPLSLIPFRPDQSPESWMYVYDSNKSCKVRPDGVIRELGVAPPTKAPIIEYGAPAWVELSDGQSASGWSAVSIDTGPTLSDRTNGGSTIAHIIYNSGTTGWCCINPTLAGGSFWIGERMQVILNTGGGSAETVVVRDILNAISTTTVASILYDSGTTGQCSMVLAGSPVGLDRNSLIQVDSEIIRVREVIPDPTGITYSIRCTTTSSHVSGATVTGLLSWYVYAANTHAASETITSQFLLLAHSAAGTGGATLGGSINGAVANGRPVDPANDYLHISFFLQNPQNVTNIQILVNMDITPNYSFTNPGNTYIWTFTQADLNTGGSSGDSWCEIVVPISSGVRTGDDLALTLANITGIAVQLISTGACAWGFDWWYLFGTYGQVIQPNAPVGVTYQTRYRDSSTGVVSVPGPQNRYFLYPLRESVIITPRTSTQPGVDTDDIYRLGGNVATFLYVSSVQNNPSSPNSYVDGLPDIFVNEADQTPDLTALQPWPILGVPISGTCNVSGTTVEITGTTSPPGGLPANLLSNTEITISGQAYLTYGQPVSSTFVELTQDAGSQTGVPFLIGSPTVAASPLPFAFGPLEGPFAPVVFALGDPLNGGLLYFSNFSNADGASDTNTLEIATPSNNLVSGAIWNGLCFAGNREDVFVVRYSYLTTIGASTNTTYQWNKVPTPSGMWARWACCTCPIGVAYLGRDGIYICTDTQGINITDERLYSLFPHDGAPAEPVNSGSNIILPVDMTQLDDLRLSYCDECLRFSYIDTDGNYNTLKYEIYRKRWFLDNFANDLSYMYMVEQAENQPNQEQILALALDTKSIMIMGGNTDNGTAINSIVLTPSDDSKDERVQKLYVDTMIMADGIGIMEVAAAFNNAQEFSPVLNITCTGPIQQYLQNIASLSDLDLYRNIGAKFAWTGGPSGPGLYAHESSGFLQPYLSSSYVTQFINLSFPGWKSARRAYPALISNSPTLLTIQTQDGRVFGPYTIASTGGQYRILPQMLDQNLKDLAFAFQLDGQGKQFALFPSDFVIEFKQWTEESYISLAVFKT